jgi:thioredoxin-related protein
MKHLILAALLMGFGATAQAVTLGDDGLHKTEWQHETFKDLREDLAEANSEGKRLLIMIEQRGCIYCTKMHEEVFPDPKIDTMLKNDYFVIQINMFGDIDVTDFDGKVLPEKDMVVRWGAMFTPTLIFLPEDVPEGKTASEAAVVTMPGAFGKGTTEALLTWVKIHGYETDEPFQKYVASRVTAGN